MISRNRRMVARAVVSSVVLMVFLTGCGPENTLNRQAVQGTVTLDGQPVSMGTIRFSPESQAGVASGGPIANGHFAIRAVDGLPPGRYIVRIYATEQDNRIEEGAPPGLATQKPGIDLIPSHYNARSELVSEVVEGEENEFEFDLKSGERNL